MSRLLLLPLSLLLAATVPATAQSQQPISDDVTIRADTQDRLPGGAIHAEGHALLTSHDLRIDADTIDFEPTSGHGPEVVAQGNVVLRRGDDVFRCSGLRLELVSGRGEFRLR